MSDNTPPSLSDALSEGAARLRAKYMGAVERVAADALRLTNRDTSRVETVTRWPAHALMESYVLVDGKRFGPSVLVLVDGPRAYVSVEYREPLGSDAP